MSTQLTTMQDNSLLSLGIGDDEGFKPVTLKLIQPIAATPDLPAGIFYDPGTGQMLKSLNVAILTIGGAVPKSVNARSMMPPREEMATNSKPVCKSLDGINPVNTPDMPRLDGGKGCEKCSHSQWKIIAGKKVRPQCGENIYLTMLDLDTQFVYRFLAKGSNLTPVKDFKKKLARIIQLSRSQKQTFTHYLQAVKLGSVYKSEHSRKWYEITFSNPTPLVDDSAIEAAKAAYQYISTRALPEEEPEVEQTISNAVHGSEEVDSAPFAPFDVGDVEA